MAASCAVFESLPDLLAIFNGRSIWQVKDSSWPCRTMDARLLFWIASTLLESALLTLFIGYLCLTRPQWMTNPCAKLRLTFQNPWKTKAKVRGSDVDLARCDFTRFIWSAVCGISFARMLVQQALLLLDREPILPAFDLQLLFLAAVGLLISCKPGLVTPKSLDVWYLLTSLLSVGCILPGSLAPNTLAMVNFRADFLFDAVTKQVWTVVFCTLVQGIYIIRVLLVSDSEPPVLATPDLVLPMLLRFAGILCARKLIHDYIVLKLDLKSRTVQLETVSALLMFSYDAVLEVDDTFTMLEDSVHLSGMLLHTGPRSDGLAGKSFLDYFPEKEQERLQKHFASWTERSPVMALNADMLDADQNRLKVELLCARTESSSKLSWLIGLRELQHLETVGPLFSDPPELSDLWVTFEVPSFETLTMSRDLEELCQQHRLKLRRLLDLSREEDRGAFSARLQDAVNQILHGEEQTIGMSFNLLGQREVHLSMTVEEDHVLEAWVGSINIYPSAKNLRLSPANLLRLGSSPKRRRSSSSCRSRSLVSPLRL